MATTTSTRTFPPQAFMTSYAPRIRTYGNALLTPVVPQSTVHARTTKRGTTAINYAEDGYDDDDFEDGDGPRRLTGLRSLRRENVDSDKAAQPKELGKALTAPVEVQGIWREWMGKTKRPPTERQVQIQSALPLNLVPIRIDLNISSFRPEAPLPTPNNARDYGIDESLPAYKTPEPTPEYRLKDYFLWNLHEALLTPDQFARVFVNELDFPTDRKPTLIMNISAQIRQQLEEYAGVAMHPLFHSASTTTAEGKAIKTVRPALSRNRSSQTPAAVNGQDSHPNGSIARIKGEDDATIPSKTIAKPAEGTDAVKATAKPIPPNDLHNPDDTYRCIINLNINLLNQLYSDKFEWSLLHPPGFAEIFAKQTCADLGLAGEWVPAVTHAIYEAVLRLKKEACENGGLVGYGEIDNDAAEGAEAGWRYEPEHLADSWEPKVETLSKEEIEKREGDRERQVRRLRRDTARFSSTANMSAGGMPQGDYFLGGIGQQQDHLQQQQSEQPLGRGERTKKKRRFRSLSPVAGTPDAAVGYGGSAGGLQDWERQNWRCSHCRVWGHAVWAVRDGPNGPRSLCNNCGYLYEHEKRLPPWSENLYATERAFNSR